MTGETTTALQVAVSDLLRNLDPLVDRAVCLLRCEWRSHAHTTPHGVGVLDQLCSLRGDCSRQSTAALEPSDITCLGDSLSAWDTPSSHGGECEQLAVKVHAWNAKIHVDGVCTAFWPERTQESNTCMLSFKCMFQLTNGMPQGQTFTISGIHLKVKCEVDFCCRISPLQISQPSIT